MSATQLERTAKLELEVLDGRDMLSASSVVPLALFTVTEPAAVQVAEKSGLHATLSTPQPLHDLSAPLARPVTVTGELTNMPGRKKGQPVGGVDMYSFRAEAGQIITFDVDTTGGLDAYLRVFEKTRDGYRTLAYNGSGRSDEPDTAEPPKGKDPFIRLQFQTTGTYFVGVSTDRNYNYDARTGLGYVVNPKHTGITGKYTLTLNTADIVALSAEMDGANSVKLRYGVTGAEVDKIQVSFYRSAQATFDRSTAEQIVKPFTTKDLGANTSRGTHEVTVNFNPISAPDTNKPYFFAVFDDQLEKPLKGFPKQDIRKGLVVETNEANNVVAIASKLITINGSLPSITKNSDTSDRDEADYLSMAFALTSPGVLETGTALLAAEYIKSNFRDFGSNLGVDHITHFLDGTGTPKDYPNGSSVSEMVRADKNFIAQDRYIQAYVKRRLDNLDQSGYESGRIDIPESELIQAFPRTTGRIPLQSNSDLFYGINGTQGLTVSGEIEVSGGSLYKGIIRYQYYDTYGFGLTDTFSNFFSNWDKISFQGLTANTLMRYLQTTGYAHWFPVTITVEVPFEHLRQIPYMIPRDQTIPAPPPAPPLGAVSGYVYVDANDNGVKESAENGIPGAVVVLSGENNSTTATTDANGFYRFSNLNPGAYSVRSTQPAVYLDGKDTAGPFGGSVSANDTISAIPVVTGRESIGNNFGELLFVSTPPTVPTVPPVAPLDPLPVVVTPPTVPPVAPLDPLPVVVTPQPGSPTPPVDPPASVVAASPPLVSLGAPATPNVAQPVQVTRPTAPSQLEAANVWQHAVDLYWVDRSATETGFVVRASIDGRTFREIGRTDDGAVRFRATNLRPYTRYWFKVSAVNDAGVSESNFIVVRTRA